MEKKAIAPKQWAMVQDICLVLGVTFGGQYDYEAKAFIYRYYLLARQRAVEELNRYEQNN